MYGAGQNTRYGMNEAYAQFRRPALTRIHSGRIWWLDSNGPGANVARGTFDKPFATLDAALAHMTANQGEILYVKQKHAENIATSAAFTVDKAGVYIIGLGQYDQRPKFTWTAGNAGLITAADVWMENLVFEANFADIATMFTVSAKGCHFVGNLFNEDTTNMNAKICISGSASANSVDGLTIVENEFNMPDALNTNVIKVQQATRDVRIVGNRILGIFVAGDAPITFSNHTNVGLIIAHNLIHNRVTSLSLIGIRVENTASSGWAARNVIGSLDAAGEDGVKSGGIACMENYNCGVLGTASCYIFPARDAA